MGEGVQVSQFARRALQVICLPFSSMDLTAHSSYFTHACWMHSFVLECPWKLHMSRRVEELYRKANRLVGFFSDFERMVSFKGMIIQCSSIIAEIREAIFRCLVCGFYTEPVAVERGRITVPTICLREDCTGSQPMQVFR